MKIGVLALQGDFAEHQVMLKGLGVEAVQVRLAEDLEGLSGLIIPGGESTTIGKLAEDFHLIEPLRQFGADHAIWGTCAGAIFLSKDTHRRQPLLQLMDITVERNAFGRQIDSFETNLDVPCLGFEDGNHNGDHNGDRFVRPFHAVFIRAPLIEAVHGDTQVLSRLPDGRIVAAQQGQWLATSFHPELTGDDRFHRYFLELSK
jgi:pyridoxal 5'-phosphate synthase pdxT subunit